MRKKGTISTPFLHKFIIIISSVSIIYCLILVNMFKFHKKRNSTTIIAILLLLTNTLKMRRYEYAITLA